MKYGTSSRVKTAKMKKETKNGIFNIPKEKINLYFGSIEYFHNGIKTCSPAYEIQEKSKLNIILPRGIGAYKVFIHIFNEASSMCLCSLEAKWYGHMASNDIYITPIQLIKLKSGLFFFSIEIYSAFGRIYGYKDGEKIRFGDISFSNPTFQLSVSDFKFDIPKQRGGIIYHIFVDRFYKSTVGNKKSVNARYVSDWSLALPEYPKYPGEPIKNNYFYGGDIWGIADKLEYIKSLGVTVIYLSPVFEAASNHKYDTANYMKVDASFGGDEALVTLIKKADRLGISVILDGVFNHTGADSIYFNKFGTYSETGAYQSPESQYFSWYIFNKYPDDYVSWWGIDILPKINTDIQNCQQYFIGNGGVIEKYAKLGISGLRLDVVDELSDGFIEGIKSKLNEYNRESLLYGEVWEDASNKIAYGKRKRYYLGKELDGVMNYPLRRGIIDFLREGKTEGLHYALTDIIFNAPKRIRDMQMNILGTHDTERIITALAGEEAYNKTNDYLAACTLDDVTYRKGKLSVMAAYTILATLPGLPAVYYGDEAGVQGYSDPFNRRTFPWGKEDMELLEHYRKIGNIRTNNSIYKSGEYKLLYLNEKLLIFSRYNKSYSYLTVVNNSEKSIILNFENTATSLLTSKKSKAIEIKSKDFNILKTSIKNHLYIN